MTEITLTPIQQVYYDWCISVQSDTCTPYNEKEALALKKFYSTYEETP